MSIFRRTTTRTTLYHKYLSDAISVSSKRRPGDDAEGKLGPQRCFGSEDADLIARHPSQQFGHRGSDVQSTKQNQINTNPTGKLLDSTEREREWILFSFQKIIPRVRISKRLFGGSSLRTTPRLASNLAMNVSDSIQSTHTAACRSVDFRLTFEGKEKNLPPHPARWCSCPTQLRLLRAPPPAQRRLAQAQDNSE